MTLFGCTQFNNFDNETLPELTKLTWNEHQEKIQQLKTWTLTGKLALFFDGDRQTANLHWQQKNENYTIQLTSFIGTHVLKITKNEQGVEIINNDGEKFTGQDANSLIKTLSPNLALPISALQQWIKGNPEAASYELNAEQRVSNLLGKDANDGLWIVSYQQYQASSKYILPRKIELKQNKMRVKIAVNQWKIKDK